MIIQVSTQKCTKEIGKKYLKNIYRLTKKLLFRSVQSYNILKARNILLQLRSKFISNIEHFNLELNFYLLTTFFFLLRIIITHLI